jgi:hypothetical protein
MEWNSIINTILSGLVGAVAAVLVARLSKSKQERDIDVAKEYLQLVGITTDQLDAKRALIGKLDEDNRTLQDEINTLKRKQAETELLRAERDEQLESMEARMSALQAQIDKDARERSVLRRKLGEFEVKNRILWKYTIALLEQMKQNHLKPVPPPEGLTDPDILKLVGEMKEGNGDEKSKA